MENEEKYIQISESFIRGYALSPEARHLYLIYTLLGEHSRDRGWVNKKGEPYIHATEDLLRHRFGFYHDLPKVHHELVALNLIQSRDSSKNSGEYSLIVRKAVTLDMDAIPIEMPRAIKRSKKTLMYQWKEFIRNMLSSSCERLQPLAQHIYCDVLAPCALAQQDTREIREDDLTTQKYIGALQPRSLVRICDHLNIKIARSRLQKAMNQLAASDLVLLAKIGSDGEPSYEIVEGDEYENAWSFKRTYAGMYTYLISLPHDGKKDYTVFFKEPNEYSELIEQISKGIPKV